MEKNATKGNDYLIAAIYKLSDWLNFYWRFYVAFIAIALGWIFSSTGDWSVIQKFVATLIFIGFNIFSISALARTKDALIETINLFEERAIDKEFVAIVTGKLKPKSWRFEVTSHLAADLTLLCCIWFLK